MIPNKHSFRQLGLLVKKNLLIQSRHPWVTVFELLLPAILAGLLQIGRGVSDVTKWPDGQNYNSTQLDYLNPVLACGRDSQYDFAFTPNTNYTTQLITETVKDLNEICCKTAIDENLEKLGENLNSTLLETFEGLKGFEDLVADKTKKPEFVKPTLGSCSDKFRIEPFETEKELNDFVYTNESSNAIFMAAVFTQSWNDSLPFPTLLDYALRPPAVPRSDEGKNGFSEGAFGWLTNTLFTGQPGVRGPIPYGPPYKEDGFLTVQHLINLNFMKLLAQENNIQGFDESKFEVEIEQFPYPPYIEDDFIPALSQNFPDVILLCLLYLALRTAKFVAVEKETGLKGYMLMMGLSRNILWTSYFIHFAMLFSIAAGIMTCVLCAPTSSGMAIITYTAPSVVFTFLFLYGISLISYGFLIASLCKSSSAASVTTIFFLFFLNSPYGVMKMDVDGTPYSTKIICSLSPPVAMGLGCNVLSAFESRTIGLQFGTISERVSASSPFTMASVFKMLILDSILYFMMARYFDLVKQGDFGVALPWYFPFQKSYWFPPKGPRNPDGLPLGSTENPCRRDTENIPMGSQAGFRLSNVTKKFTVKKEIKTAVDDLSFVAFDNQITVLLGHNGAGKSTTMNMLSGMLSVDSGDCFVGKYDVTTNITEARKHLGLCPQHNILIAELTVAEHLQFFAQLKGFSRQDAKQELEELAVDIQLHHKINIRAHYLSGGMKRKLSLGIALCGDSKYLILDEPSSGVDVRARRELWTILQKYRQNRAMLVSTHYMDEAEAIADRIIIIGKGQLKCEGTTSFLKTTLGQGYHLNLSMKQNYDIKLLENAIVGKIPTARMQHAYGTEVKYILPFTDMKLFSSLFRLLDQSGDDLGICNYGASITTMDEIFMSVTKDCSAESFQSLASEDEDGILAKLAKRKRLIKGHRLRLQQFKGAFFKCFLHAVRNKGILIFQLLMPMIFVLMAISIIDFLPTFGDQPMMDLSLYRYQPPNIEALSLTTIYNANSSYSDSISAAVIGDLDQFANCTNEIEIGKSCSKLEDVSDEKNLQKLIPDMIDEDVTHFNDKYILAFEVSENETTTKFKSYFNGDAFHAIASSLLYVHRIILNEYFSGLDGIGIKTSNHPLPSNSSESMKTNTNFFIQGSLISFFVTTGTMLVFGAFVHLPVKERQTGVKTLQRCSGAPPWILWVAQYVWDMINCIPAILIVLIVLNMAADVPGVDTFIENTSILAGLFILFTFAHLPWCYCFSYLFSHPASAIMWTNMANVLLSQALLIAAIIIALNEDSEDTGILLDNIFCVFPQYCLTKGLYNLYWNANIAKMCKESKMMEIACEMAETKFVTDPITMEREGIGRYLLALSILTPLNFILLWRIEHEQTTRKIRSFFVQICCGKNSAEPANLVEEPEDIDVITEREIAVAQKADNDTVLVLDGLSKRFGSFLAVDGISFGVKSNECFGLVGPNGAGKTTTFKMLTGEHDISSGNAFIQNLNIKTDRFASAQRFGYCPQFDALLDQLTGREMLILYSRLRGVPENDIKDSIDLIIKLIGITPHADKYASTYSGGTKRKLSVGIALVGFPPVLILDEPSCGLDPGARRKQWSVISGAQRAGTAVLLTSHSMEECAALCDRLAIVVNGRLKCIGGQQHLKAKFSEGTEIEIESTNGENALNAIKARCPTITVSEKYQNMMKLKSKKSLSLSTLFDHLEAIKNQKLISSYTVNQTSLEQIFLKLTENQRRKST